MSLEIVILAAGQGKRMHSSTPKVLHRLAGKPLLQWVYEKALSLNPTKIHILVGHQAERIKSTLAHLDANWIIQPQLLGTGHAMICALPHINPNSQVLILSGDVPLISEKTLKKMAEGSQPGSNHHEGICLLVADVINPAGLGRIKRNESGEILGIVEEKDANEHEKAIREIYSGICLTHAAQLEKWLPQLKDNNAQKEFYLTDVIRIAFTEGLKITSIKAQQTTEIMGINSRAQLQDLERAYQQESAYNLMSQGVSLADAQRIDIRGHLNVEQDVFIDINNIFEGAVSIGETATLGQTVTSKMLSYIKTVPLRLTQYLKIVSLDLTQT